MARPLVIIGGYLTSAGDFAKVSAALEQPPFNYRVFVVPIGRLRWALTRDWDFRPVLALIRATVQQALEVSQSDRLTILAHSVGGVAARIFLGEQPYQGEIYGGRRYVERLVTLGTPHTSLERWTRNLYNFVNSAYPGAYYSDVHYVAVTGQALQGSRSGRWIERMAFNSYTMVAGTDYGTTWGDGVTPLLSAVLRGAEFLVVPALHHSPFHGHPWYGDVEALAHWGRVLR